MKQWRPVTESLVVMAAMLSALGFAPGRVFQLALLTTANPDTTSDVLQGVTLGIEEAQHAAELLGDRVLLVRVVPGAAMRPVNAVLSVLPADDLLHWAAAARDTTPVFNLVARADSLRGSSCRARIYHIEASDTMYRTAGGADDSAELWNPALERYGASQLNERYQKRFGKPMSGAAWAGWFGVKVAWERFTGRQDGFDGHKGELLSFRSWDHQLRQPLYLKSNGPRIRQVPSDSLLDADAVQALDQLAGDSSVTRCRYPR